VLAGRFVDVNGRPVLGEIDDRLIGMTLEAICAVPDRICVAAGEAKAIAIRALLAGGFISSLVTDQLTATALLEGPGPLAT